MSASSLLLTLIARDQYTAQNFLCHDLDGRSIVLTLVGVVTRGGGVEESSLAPSGKLKKMSREQDVK